MHSRSYIQNLVKASSSLGDPQSGGRLNALPSAVAAALEEDPISRQGEGAPEHEKKSDKKALESLAGSKAASWSLISGTEKSRPVRGLKAVIDAKKAEDGEPPL